MWSKVLRNRNGWYMPHLNPIVSFTHSTKTYCWHKFRKIVHWWKHKYIQSNVYKCTNKNFHITVIHDSWTTGKETIWFFSYIKIRNLHVINQMIPATCTSVVYWFIHINITRCCYMKVWYDINEHEYILVKRLSDISDNIPKLNL